MDREAAGELQAELLRLSQNSRRNQLYLGVALSVVGIGSLLAIGFLGFLGHQLVDQLSDIRTDLRASQEQIDVLRSEVSEAAAQRRQQLQALANIHDANRKLSDELAHQRTDMARLRERSQAIQQATEDALENLRVSASEQPNREGKGSLAGGFAAAAGENSAPSHGTTSYRSSDPRPLTEIKGFVGTHPAIRRAERDEALPAHLRLEVRPERPGLGDPYQLRVFVVNRTNKAIDLTSLRLAWNFDGKKTGGALPPQVQQVKPRSSAVVYGGS